MFEHSLSRQDTAAALTIRPYQSSDERTWLRCSVLAFLETSYFDSVFRHKPQYDHPAIELVAVIDETIVGMIDVECEDTPGSVCTVCAAPDPLVRGGMIWHLAVHPDFQRVGIGGRLLREAQRLATERGVTCLEAWTRDDAGTLRWYESHGFEWVKSYLHIYLQGRAEMDGAIGSSIPGLKPVNVFAHYVGNDVQTIRARFDRVHDCNCFRMSC
jgi:ribosomal protein S18 acetylase RimI-like enzyme